MKIGLVDIDGFGKKKKWGGTVYPNLALCKIARWHRQQGDDVDWAIPMLHYDRVYMSKVFNFSPDDRMIYDAGNAEAARNPLAGAFTLLRRRKHRQRS